MQKIIILGQEQKHEPCEYCGKISELRPYGENGAKMCFDCGMKPENLATTERTFDRILEGLDQKPKEDQNN
jgi:hypothetical protein